MKPQILLCISLYFVIDNAFEVGKSMSVKIYVTDPANQQEDDAVALACATGASSCSVQQTLARIESVVQTGERALAEKIYWDDDIVATACYLLSAVFFIGTLTTLAPFLTFRKPKFVNPASESLDLAICFHTNRWYQSRVVVGVRYALAAYILGSYLYILHRLDTERTRQHAINVARATYFPLLAAMYSCTNLFRGTPYFHMHYLDFQKAFMMDSHRAGTMALTDLVFSLGAPCSRRVYEALAREVGVTIGFSAANARAALARRSRHFSARTASERSLAASSRNLAASSRSFFSAPSVTPCKVLPPDGARGCYDGCDDIAIVKALVHDRAQACVAKGGGASPGGAAPDSPWRPGRCAPPQLAPQCARPLGAAPAGLTVAWAETCTCDSAACRTSAAGVDV